MNPINERRTGQALADDFISRVLEAERTYLTSLWLDPIRGHTAAVDAGLCGADFLLPAHSLVFMYVCMCAERDIKTTVADCVAVARSGGVQIGTDRPFPYTDGRLFLYSDILAPHLDEVCEGSCAFYAQAVKGYTVQRREAQQAFRKYSQILGRTTHAARKPSRTLAASTTR